MEVKNWFWHSGLFRVKLNKVGARENALCVRKWHWNQEILKRADVILYFGWIYWWESRRPFSKQDLLLYIGCVWTKKRQNRPFLHVEVVKESKTMKIRSICVSIEFKLFSCCQASIYWRICKLVQFWSQSEFLLVTYN